MQTLVIGSTVVDVLIYLPAIPARGEDINIAAPSYRIGGCAYNVYKALKLYDSPALLCSPCGAGIYGSMVREYLSKEGIIPFISLEEENGCCFCLVEPDGERSFLSHHGAEYLFSRSWMNSIDYSQVSGIYISGLEVEDPSGEEIVDFVYAHPELDLYFAPGPRITHISSERMNLLLSRRDRNGKGPLLHLNEKEALEFSGKGRVEEAALFIAGKTGNHVVVTLGKRGCYCVKITILGQDGQGKFIPGIPIQAGDTVGAGDTHCGSLIACLKNGMDLEDACLEANKAGAARVAR